MATPKQGYYLANGDKVPGVTTIIGRWKDSGGLIQWAYKQGREHEGLARQGKDAPRSLYEVTEEAADIGTQIHAMVEQHIKREQVALPIDERVVSGYGAYLSWEHMSQLEIVAQEIQMVSEKHKYGGTPDAIGKLDGQLCVLDWKSSNAVYTDHLIQVAAYGALWEETHPDQPITGGYHICRFSKENGDFSHHHFPALEDAWGMFVHMRAMSDLDKKLKKRV